MTDTDPSARIASSADEELLGLYLSLPPAAREKIFIDTKHAARITGMSMRTIQLWVESGAVRAIVISTKYRILLKSLRAYLERQMDKRSE